MNILDQFNDFEKSIIAYQGHALAMNEFKSNGSNDVSIDTYLTLLDSVINFLYSVGDCINQNEMTIKNQQEQIDRLLDYLHKGVTV